MVSGYSPPILYLTDDEDDNNNNSNHHHHHQHHQHTEFNGNSSYQNSYERSSRIYRNTSGKKRTLPDGNIQMNPSTVNWTKRLRNDRYQNQLIQHDTMTHQPEIINYDPRLYDHINDESHSFHAFDWTNDVQAPQRTYSNTTNSVLQMPILTSPNIMNVVKQQINHLDSPPSYSQSHKTDRYHQHSLQKTINMPIISTGRSSPPTQSSLPLPLPTPTSTFTRSPSQRIHPEKNLRISYPHPNPPTQIRHPVKPVHQPRHSPVPPPLTRRTLSPASAVIPVSTSEIRQQALNGTGILSAFYDSKCYRCNICKFKTSTSSLLLQHLYTHIFYCNQCSFYSYSHHHLYQHIFEKHSNHTADISDPKTLELLYITRCSDGTFALSTDTTPTQSSQPPPPVLTPVPTPSIQVPKTLPKASERIKSTVNNEPPKRKSTRGRPRLRKLPINEVVVPVEKPDENLQTSSSLPAVNATPVSKEKSTYIYVLMKHRRCYSMSNPPCSHPLTLEYNICREHTIRHMCHTNNIVKRQKIKPKTNSKYLIVEVSKCLKFVVNEIVHKEHGIYPIESTDAVCLLPNRILNRIFSIDDLESLTSMLKLTNKYTKKIEKNHQYRSESMIRSSNQHLFILSSTSINKVEPSLFSSLQASITNGDSPYTQTKLQNLPISCDNTPRFLKGHLNSTPRPTVAMQSNTNDKPRRSIESNHSEGIPRCMSKSLIDKDNSSNTSPKSRTCAEPCVIVLD